jgi:nanoRNase/pAp phosphatase (c-di-AMP/oligoRNAs hydrolase)
MLSVLGIRASHVRHLKWNNYRHFALVDSQPRTGNNQLPAEILPDIVIDHHPARRVTQQVPFSDIRTDYGASATIVAEYLAAAGIDIPRKLATAFIYAIRTETQDFRREFIRADKELHDSLLPNADNRALARIQRPRLPLSYFETTHRALERLLSVETLVLTHLEEVPQPDIVPEMADLLLRMEGKTWSLCTGAFEHRLYLSVRTSNPRADAGRLMRRLIGRRGKGGGHGMAAGGWVALEPRPDESREQAAERLATYVGRRLAVLLKKNPDRLLPVLPG